ncbi:MAG: 2,4-dichlorophenol 6-monooxygenase [Proteobacteria bacterium]|nr:MAG: 2,4-dichlorophenol 6-monooxygenase [Pseudomonadota bacterium]
MEAVTEAPVLVVGGGPVGLVAAILLAQHGLGCVVAERRRAPAPAPAAHVVNARSFEILRSAGADMGAIAAACKSPDDAGAVRWVTTLFGDELGQLPFERQGDDVLALTPTPLRNLSQHRLEPILVEHVRSAPGAELASGWEWESSEQDAAGVTSRLREVATGRTRSVRSRWLLAADGAGSGVRRALGIEPIGPARIASFVMIHFEANLRARLAQRPAVLYWTTAPGAAGTFVAHDLDSTWVFMHAYDADAESPADYDAARCAAIVRRAMGDPDAAVPIRTISTWQMTAQVAERYRAGRIFLLGDAAHRFPPSGGLGLNTGVQDAHNLVWKIAAAEAGWADVSLLDSYERERKPVAHTNADVSLRNAVRMLEVHQALASPDDGGREARVAAAIAAQAEHFDMLGLQLGFRYEAGALVDDGGPHPCVADPVRVYAPSGRPGARLPHAWVGRDPARVSTLDLVAHDGFTLVTGRAADGWRDAARTVADAPLRVVAIGTDVPDSDGAWTALLGIDDDGALLVRPDQHVAWRALHAAHDAAAALPGALRAVLAR